MSAIDKVREAPPPVSASTLSELLQKTAHAKLPSQFYGLLQICLPLAYQAWTWGLHRTAGWLVVASAFGLWALGQQHLKGHSESDDDPPPPRSKLRGVWRLVRGGAAAIGSVGAFVLFLEAFVRLMSGVFKCPGCAG